MHLRLTRTSYYSAQINDHNDIAVIKRLRDGMQYGLYGADAANLARRINVLTRLDDDQLGTKPSRVFCEAFDRMCEGYYEREDKRELKNALELMLDQTAYSEFMDLPENVEAKRVVEKFIKSL